MCETSWYMRQHPSGNPLPHVLGIELAHEPCQTFNKSWHIKRVYAFPKRRIL
jgi:hypothetical protein